MELKIEGIIKSVNRTNFGISPLDESGGNFLEVTLCLEQVPTPIREVLISAIGRDPVRLVLEKR
jgi:hypothetical protein